jgi:hypothetical protein
MGRHDDAGPWLLQAAVAADLGGAQRHRLGEDPAAPTWADNKLEDRTPALTALLAVDRERRPAHVGQDRQAVPGHALPNTTLPLT